jgi:hypothetical protein
MRRASPIIIPRWYTDTCGRGTARTRKIPPSRFWNSTDLNKGNVWTELIHWNFLLWLSIKSRSSVRIGVWGLSENSGRNIGDCSQLFCILPRRYDSWTLCESKQLHTCHAESNYLSERQTSQRFHPRRSRSCKSTAPIEDRDQRLSSSSMPIGQSQTRPLIRD